MDSMHALEIELGEGELVRLHAICLGLDVQAAEAHAW